MDPAFVKLISEVGTTVVLIALFVWMVVKEGPAQRREADKRLDTLLAEERQARKDDREAMVVALKENTESNAHLSGQIEKVCKHPGTCPR